jgi:hypothetical protein
MYLFWFLRARIFPRSLLLGTGQVGFWEVGRGMGQLGEGEQMGSVYKQPEREEDDSCHIWKEPSKWKGTQGGEQRGISKGSKGSEGNCAVYICKRDVCARAIGLLE